MSLPFDHDAEAALAALSVPTEATPGGFSRRRFLAGLGAAGVLGTLAGPAALRRASARAAAGDRNLVVFYLGGGNDGFATVMPTSTSVLDTLRPSLLVPKAKLLDIGGGYGLHPSLPGLHARHQAGQVALVGGVGTYGSLSHFEANGDWMTGGQRPADAGTGWVGRWLDGLGAGADNPLRATSFTGQVPRLLVGHQSGGAGLGTTGGSLLGASRKTAVERGLYELVESWGAAADPATGAGHAADVAGTASSLAAGIGPIYSSPVPTGFADQATLAARLLNDPGYGCRSVFCAFGGFDHHADLVNQQAARLTQLDAAITAFFNTLAADVAARTAVLVYSEFGRRAAVNGSAGTDHGTASYSFLLGPTVAGGLYGEHLDATDLDSHGNPVATVRHLDLIGTVLRWLGADADGIVGTSTTDLGCFA